MDELLKFNLEDLNKKFVWVSGTKGVTIETLGTDITEPTGKYFRSIVFDHTNGVIWNHGRQYGMDIAAANELTTLVEKLDKAVNGSNPTLVPDTSGKAPGEDGYVPTKLVQDENGKNPGEEGYIETKETVTSEDNGLLVRVAAIETLINANNNNTIDKLQEVLDWFAGVEQDKDPYKVTIGEKEIALGEGQVGLLTTVAKNKDDIANLKDFVGFGSHPATQEEADKINEPHLVPDGNGKNPGDEGYEDTYEPGYVPVEPGDPVRPATQEEVDEDPTKYPMSITDVVPSTSPVDEKIKTAIDALDVPETTVETESGDIKVTYKEVNGIVEIVKVESVAAEVTYVPVTYTAEEAEALNAEHEGEEGWVEVKEGDVKPNTPGTITIAEGDEDKFLAAESTIDALTDYVKDVAAEVAAKAAGKDVTVTVNGEEDETYISANNGKDAHEINIKTATLNDVLGGIDKDENGEYIFAPAEGITDGLATAADIAAVIVSDEEVIAAAFNDHEFRVASMENWPVYDWEEL